MKTIHDLLMCPCCKSVNIRDIELTTDWGFEPFNECLDCGILFRGFNTTGEDDK